MLCFLRFSVLGAILAAMSSPLNGCSGGLGLWPVAQSHLTTDGTNIVPLGNAEGTADDFFVTWGGLPDFMHSDLQAEAVRNAIQAKEGDLLINYTLSVRVTRFPLGLLLVDLSAWWVIWTAEGTAAKVQQESVPSRRNDVGDRPS
jgi:hypothetical protein